MASTSGYSKRSSSVKRLLQEAKELAGESTNDGIHAAPFEENLYHWHFTIEGPKDSEFDGGLYHGRITVGHAYPATSASQWVGLDVQADKRETMLICNCMFVVQLPPQYPFKAPGEQQLPRQPLAPSRLGCPRMQPGRSSKQQTVR